VAVGQALFLHRIDLPDLVGRLPPTPVLGWAAQRRAIDPGGPEVALEGPLVREGLVGPTVLELEANEDGAPGGVEPLEPAGGADQAGGGAWPDSAASRIVRSHGVGAEVADAPPELANRDERDIQLRGDKFEGLSLLAALKDGLPQWDGDGLWHESPPLLD
jgi:hypothetical protein